jgi:hypothetical protein
MNIKSLNQIAIAFSMIHQSYIHDEKNRIYREWDNSMYLPRKKKKAIRKNLELDFKLLKLMDF